MIIHICGPSGSGKTTLGNKLKKKYGNKIVVKDLDDLRDEFIKSYYGKKRWTFINVQKYQKYINDYIKKHSKKTIIFVGLNDNIFGRNKELYYNIHSDYNFYIDIDDNVIITQKCERFILEFLPEILKHKKKDITDFTITHSNSISGIKKATKHYFHAKSNRPWSSLLFNNYFFLGNK